MSDHRLRELERQWAASGSPDDRLAWLRERQRQGQDPVQEFGYRCVQLFLQAQMTAKEAIRGITEAVKVFGISVQQASANAAELGRIFQQIEDLDG